MLGYRFLLLLLHGFQPFFSPSLSLSLSLLPLPPSYQPTSSFLPTHPLSLPHSLPILLFPPFSSSPPSFSLLLKTVDCSLDQKVCTSIECTIKNFGVDSLTIDIVSYVDGRFFSVSFLEMNSRDPVFSSSLLFSSFPLFSFHSSIPPSSLHLSLPPSLPPPFTSLSLKVVTLN